MRMVQSLVRGCILSLGIILVSCSGVTNDPAADAVDGGETDGDTLSTTVDTSGCSVSVAESAASWDAADVADSLVFAEKINLDFDSMTARLEDADPVTITEAGVSPVAGVSIAVNGVALSVVSTLTDPIRLTITGSLAKTLLLDLAAPCDVVLNGVDVAAGSGPALSAVSGEKTFLTIAAGTSNAFADSADPDSSVKQKGAVYAGGAVIIDGSGTLTVNGSYKHGIYSDDYVRVRGGNLTVNESVRDAIRTVNGFILDDGNLTIVATGTVPGDESKGIKVEGEESTTGAGKGWVYINGGTLTITSVSKGITAGWDVEDDAETTDTSDDPAPFVVINSGVIKVTTTGDTYEEGQNASYPDASCSPEGIEGKSTLTVNGGFIEVYTDDDCLNAGDSIALNGGYIYCVAANNDAIDSNGTLTISGGVIVAVGATQPEGAFDCDQNTFSITGGILAGIGGSSSTPTASACTQNAFFSYDGLSKGETFALVNASGETVFAFDSPGSGESFVFSSPDIADGTYSLQTGGTLAGTYYFGGLYLDDLASSGGTAERAVTEASPVTTTGTTTTGHGPNGR